MENFSKNIPSGLKVTLSVLFSVLLLVLSISQGLIIRDKLEPKKTITFSGEGKTIGIPDVISVTLSVITEKSTAKETMSENAKTMNEIIKFIKESGVEEKDVKTQSYSLSPQYDWIEGKRIFRGYQLTSTLLVKIRDLEKISSIIDGAVSKGANQVEDIQFIIDEPEKLKEEARNKAIENAKEKAKSIAKTTGLKLGKIVSFSESVSQEIPPRPYYLEMEKGIGGGTAPEIEKGSQEIKVEAFLTFELKR